MDQNLAYFTEFCSLVDFKFMKTVDDDTISDPKPRPKKHPKPEPSPLPIPDTEEPPPRAPRKDFKLEKSKKPREKYQKIRDEVQQPERGPERRTSGFKRNSSPGNFDRKNSGDRRPDGRKFSGKKEFGDRRPDGRKRDFDDKSKPRGKFQKKKDFQDKPHSKARFDKPKTGGPKKFKPQWRD
jgi:hypothetical protein